MKKFFKEFKEFISRGNVLNLAVGIIIGAAFTAIVNSLVGDVIMPLIALLGGKDITDWKLILKEGATDPLGNEIAEIAIHHGLFLQAVINFVLIAFVLFLIIKIVMGVSARAQQLKEKLAPTEEVEEEEEEPKLSDEVILLTEIRDALVKKDTKK